MGIPIQIRLPDDVLAKIDASVQNREFINRSDAVRFAVYKVFWERNNTDRAREWE